MPNWRVSFVFRNAVSAESTSGSLFGWTESVYTASSMDAATVTNLANTLLGYRRQLLTPGWRVARIRFSQYPFNRVAFAPGVSPAGGVGRYPIGGGVTDEQPYDKLICQMVCVSGRSRSLELGGIGSDVVDAGGVYLAPGAWTANFPQWVAEMADHWAVLRRGGTSSRLLYAVYTTPQTWDSGISAYAPVIYVDNSPGAIPYPVNIRISPSPGTCGLAGVWQVIRGTGPPGVTYYGLSPKRGNQVIGTYGGGGRISIAGSSYDQFAAGTAIRGTSRRTGGSIDRPRGRRSRRRS